MRGALVALSAAGALAAVVLGARHTWPDLSHARYHLTRSEAAHAAAAHEGLPVALFDQWKARLRPGDRWWVDVPAGKATGLTNLGAVYRTYALYWLLPNLPAHSEASADVVLETRVLP